MHVTKQTTVVLKFVRREFIIGGEHTVSRIDEVCQNASFDMGMRWDSGKNFKLE